MSTRYCRCQHPDFWHNKDGSCAFYAPPSRDFPDWWCRCRSYVPEETEGAPR